MLQIDLQPLHTLLEASLGAEESAELPPGSPVCEADELDFESRSSHLRGLFRADGE